MAKNRFTDREFQKLAERIKNAIDENEGLIGDQQAQIERLISLERKFRNDICKYGRAAEVYRLFVDKFSTDGDNILSAQSYFREKSTIFRRHISSAIREKDSGKLMEFDINYQFIQFVVDNWDGDLPERSQRYYNELTDARRILIENNLPLAINRAKIFYKKTPRSHLSLLDLIDICVYGLIAGVDKFVGEDYHKFAGVCIGRMVGFLIEEYSKSFIRLFPSDKKILYRANALKHRLNIDNIEELTEAVNESFEKDRAEGKGAPKEAVTEIQIRTLMNSSNYVSANATSNDGEDDEDGGCIYDYTASSETVEEEVEKRDTISKVLEAVKDLEMIEKKIIRLKGVDL